MKRRTLIAATALSPSLALAQAAAALRWIVPYPAGGGSDVIARAIAEAMQKNFEQPIVIDNRPGGATNIGAELTARAKPDGTTIMSADNASLMFNQFLFTKLAYDPQSSFSFVSGIGRFPMALVVHPGFAADSVADFVRVARAKPGSIDYSSPGNGSAHHITMELFKQSTGVSITHIPYRGAAPALLDVMNGQVSAMMVDLAAGLPAIKSAKVKALAITSGRRAPTVPGVPTMAESGIEGVDGYALQAVVAPAGLPAPVQEKLSKAIHAAIREPHVTRRLLDFGAELMEMSPQELKQFVDAERTRWGAVIRKAGVRLD